MNARTVQQPGGCAAADDAAHVLRRACALGPSACPREHGQRLFSVRRTPATEAVPLQSTSHDTACRLQRCGQGLPRTTSAREVIRPRRPPSANTQHLTAPPPPPNDTEAIQAPTAWDRVLLHSEPDALSSAHRVPCRAERRPLTNTARHWASAAHPAQLTLSVSPHRAPPHAYDTRAEAVADSYFQVGGSAFTPL